MATPDYVMTEDFDYMTDSWDKKIIPAGAFVRPIDQYYVPKHVRNTMANKNFDWETETFCYTPRDGIIAIPNKMFRKT